VPELFHTEGLRLGSAALKPLAEWLASQQVQRKDAAFAVLRCFLDPLPFLD
jgi:hypothetical protein